MDRDQIKEMFIVEFAFLQDKFVIFDLNIEEARESNAEHIWKPGVYVFWHPKRGVIKIGRHLTNARKRAFEHLRDNTGGTMSKLLGDSETRLLLFTVKNDNDKHWPAALEIYFEERLKPEIKANRLG